MRVFHRRHRPSHLEDLRESRDREIKQLNRLVEALAEQIEYLRFQLQQVPKLGQPLQPVARTYTEAPDLPDLDLEPGLAPYVGDEEEDLRYAHEAGLIDTVQLQNELEALGVHGPLDVD